MKIVLYGPPETLKTRMGLALARLMAGGQPILLIDAEAGFCPAADLPALRVVSYDDVPGGQARNGPYAFAHRARAAIDEFITAGQAPPVLVIDSLSVLQKRLIASIEESTSGPAPDEEPSLQHEIDSVHPTSLFNYRVSARILRRLLNHAFALRGSYVIVAHERQDLIEVEAGPRKKTSFLQVGPDLQKSVGELVLAHADIVAHTFRDRNGRVRIHVGAGGVWENPRTYIVTKDRFRRFPEPGVLTPKAFIQALIPTVPPAVPAGGEASP